MGYLPGKKMPCDYDSRHPPSKQFTKAEEEEWCIQSEEEILVSRIVQELAPSAIPIEMLKQATSDDKELQQLKDDLSKRKECRPELKSYRGIFEELSVVDGLILKGYQIVIPKAYQAEVIAIAHESHFGIHKTVGQIRETCWFPKMHEMVKE